MKVQGKVVVVTGAGNGMAREVVLELLKRGARVAAVDLSADGLAETVRLAGNPGERLTTHVVNVAQLDEVAALPAAVIAAHGQVDGIMNIAGIIHKFKKVADLTYEEIHRVMDVNFFGDVHMVKEFLPHLKARPEAQILNISSMGSYVPVPGQTIYGASKAAVKLFTEGLRSELAGTNVGVGMLFPGAISTNIATNSGAFTAEDVERMSKSTGAKQHKMTAPDVAGRAIVDAFEGNPFHAFAGSDATMMYRLSRLMPERAAKIIQRQMANLLG